MATAAEAPAGTMAEGTTSHTQNRAALVPATRTPAPTSQALSLNAMSVQDAWGFAKALAESALLPRHYQNSPGSVLWALEYGRGIGLDVITTIQSVHVIQGKATQSADLMAALTRRAGHRMRMTSTDERAEVTIYRCDDPEFPFTAVWDTAKAVRAKLLNKDTWQQYPAAMLRARAISECVRMACPEVLHGAIYTPEEIGAAVDGEGIPLDVPSPQPAPRPAPPQEDRSPSGVTVVSRDAFVPHPDGQEFADQAAAAETVAAVESLRSTAEAQGIANSGIVAPDTNVPDVLADYLSRRLTALGDEGSNGPVFVTPPEFMAKALADVPAESLTPAGRDYLHEAHAAPDAAMVRLIWQDAKTEGSRPEYLEQIVQVGREKAAQGGDAERGAA